MTLIRFKRGTRAEIDAAATASELNQGEPYYITDEDVYAVGSGVDSYIEFPDLATFNAHTHTLADITDSGTAAAADIGTDPSEVPLNSDLGSAAYVDTGTDGGDVPTVADMLAGNWDWTGVNDFNRDDATPYSTDLETFAGLPDETEVAAFINSHIDAPSSYCLQAFMLRNPVSGGARALGRWGMTRTGTGFDGGVWVWQLRGGDGATAGFTREVMRLTVDGLGVFNDNPAEKLDVNGRVKAHQYHQNAIHAHGNTSGAKTIALADGNYQTMTLTGNSTFSFTAPPGPCSCNILITNSGAGNKIALPGGVVFETGAQNTADGAKYVLTIIYDGTDYWVSWAT